MSLSKVAVDSIGSNEFSMKCGAVRELCTMKSQSLLLWAVWRWLRPSKVNIGFHQVFQPYKLFSLDLRGTTKQVSQDI